MEYRNTPLKHINYSPAQLLYSRNIRTKLPCSNLNLQPKYINHEEIRNRLKFRKEQQKKYYDKHSKKLPPLLINESVLLQKGKIWVPALVLKVLGNNSFIVKDEEGRVYRRNRVYLSKTKIKYRLKLNLIDHFDSISRIGHQQNDMHRLLPSTENLHIDQSEESNDSSCDEDATLTYNQEYSDSNDSESYFSNTEEPSILNKSLKVEELLGLHHI